MKKTLAAVLAAAMALSTASVVFAADSWNTVETDKDFTSHITAEDDKTPINKDQDTRVSFTAGSGYVIDTGLLAQALEDNIVKSAVTVTDGRNNFATIPNVSSQRDGDTNTKYARLRYKIAHNYGTSDIKVGFRVKFTVAKDAYIVGYAKAPVTAGSSITDANVTYKLVSKKPTLVDYDTKDAKKGDPVLIWGTASDKSLRGLKASEADGAVKVLSKGDTYVSDDYTATGKYDEVDYAEEITITEQECKDGKTLVKKDPLFDNADDDGKVTFYFDDYAAYKTKVSSAQKNLNLYYTTEVSQDLENNIVDVFPDVDFEFITFKGSSSVTSFVNSGEMTFPAIGGKNTVVYRYIQAGGGDSDYLEPIGDYTGYDSTYQTITVKNVKNLSGTFVIASKMLDIEEEEDNEPVDSAPVVEEPSSSEPTTVVEKNPSTGAC